MRVLVLFFCGRQNKQDKCKADTKVCPYNLFPVSYSLFLLPEHIALGGIHELLSGAFGGGIGVAAHHGDGPLVNFAHD